LILATSAGRRIFVDHAVALVQTYLQLNGYFTTAEYPIVEATDHHSFRSVTDIDILAFRFPNASVFGELHSLGPKDHLLDPSDTRIDLVIGEVKEGKVQINSPTSNPDVLRMVLARFGCIEQVEHVAAELIEKGKAITPEGYSVQVIVFGGVPRNAPALPCKVISLGHVLKYLQAYVRTHWAMLRHIQFKDPAFSFLMTLEKAKRGERRTKNDPVAPAGVQERRGTGQVVPLTLPVKPPRRGGHGRGA
jgi:hypothetical protein